MKDRMPVLSTLIGALLLAACSGPQQTTQQGPTDVDPGTATPVVLAELEDFDPAPYREEPPVITVEYEHDVPAQLLDGQAARGVLEVVQGYRIQIFQALERNRALRREEDAKGWWRIMRNRPGIDNLFPNELPVYVHFRQPYYRVRIGDFASRQEAEQALEYVSERFSSAFIAPDVVTVIR